MRTRFELSFELAYEIHDLATQQGRSAEDLVEDLLRRALLGYRNDFLSPPTHDLGQIEISSIEAEQQGFDHEIVHFVRNTEHLLRRSRSSC